MGVNVEVLTDDDPQALSHLAWHELVETAETSLPILVLDDSSTISGAISIKKYLNKLKINIDS
jgi:hypothetical protein